VKSLKAAPSGVQFLVNAPPRGYSGPSGPVYAFEFYPKTETVPGGLQALAMVTYKMNHPTFKNTILAAGPDRDFKASYDGWGCLTRVIAIIEYRDPDKKAEVTEFNMCQLLHWQTFKALDSRILP
jgi:hypothetical protein